MRQIMSVVLFMVFFPLCSEGALVFDFVPSAETTNINGIQFSPPGSDFIVTNTLVQERGLPLTSPSLWTDFKVLYDRTDSDGNVFYRPDDFSKVFVIDTYLGSQHDNPTTILVRDVMDGESEAFNLGNGRYEYQAKTLGGKIDFTFNTNLPLGHQVECGTFTYDYSSVPEPTSFVMMGLGGLISAIGYTFRKMLTPI